MNNLNNMLSKDTIKKITNLTKHIDPSTGLIETENFNNYKDALPQLISEIYNDIGERTSTVVFKAHDKNSLDLDKDRITQYCYVTLVGLNAQCRQLNMFNVTLLDIMYRLLEYNNGILFDHNRSTLRLKETLNIEAFFLDDLLCKCSDSFYIDKMDVACVDEIIQFVRKTNPSYRNTKTKCDNTKIEKERNL